MFSSWRPFTCISKVSIYLGGTGSLILLQNRHILSIHRQLIPASFRRHEYPITAVVVPSSLSLSLLSSSALSVNRLIGIPVAIPSRRCHSPDSNSSSGQISQRSFDIYLPILSTFQGNPGRSVRFTGHFRVQSRLGRLLVKRKRLNLSHGIQARLSILTLWSTYHIYTHQSPIMGHTSDSEPAKRKRDVDDAGGQGRAQHAPTSLQQGMSSMTTAAKGCTILCRLKS